MTLSSTDLRQLSELANLAAREAGEVIARARPEQVDYKAEGASLASQVVTETDRLSEQLIVDRLIPSVDRFGLGLLTEERPDNGGRLSADYFWCVDPLDGTLPFIEGAPGFAVSIALVSHDGTPILGSVYDPVACTLFHAIRGNGAFRDAETWRVAPHNGHELGVFVDRSFLDRDYRDVVVSGLDQIAGQMGLGQAQLHVGAGAVMNAVGVLSNPPSCYLKYPAGSGGGSLWDFAATACLFHELGAVSTDIDGAPLDLNRADSTSMSHRGVLFATNEPLAQRIRALPAAGGLSRQSSSRGRPS